MKFRALALLLTVLSTTALSQEMGVSAANVSKFDIYGVRLHSSGDDVLRTLRLRFPKERVMIHRGRSDVSGKQMVRSVDLETYDIRLSVAFVESLSPVRAPEQAEGMSLTFKGTMDAVNHTKAFREELLKKYGRPSRSGDQMQDGRERDYWCEKLLPRGYTQAATYPCDEGQPYATFFLNTFSVQEPSLTDAVKNWISDHTPKPAPKKLPRL